MVTSLIIVHVRNIVQYKFTYNKAPQPTPASLRVRAAWSRADVGGSDGPLRCSRQS